MDVKKLIDELNNAPRYGRPEFGKTVVITDTLAKELVLALQQPKVTYKHRHTGRIEGASPT